MIKNKKKTSKAAAVVSAILAAALLTTTVFASGVISDLTADDYTIEITNNGEKIELVNKPFIENGEVYLPLRETFEKIGIMEHKDSKIEWNDGKIDLCIAYYTDDAVTSEQQSLNNGQGVESFSVIYNHAIEIDKPVITVNTAPNLAGQYITTEHTMDNAPTVRNSTAYVPYSYAVYMLNGSRDIQYTVYDLVRK